MTMLQQANFLRTLIAALSFSLAAGCSTKSAQKTSGPAQPNFARFDSTVASPALRDSLRQGKLVVGMPYFVAAQIFASSRRDDQAIPVAGLGRRQRLQERDVRYRDLGALNLQIYLNEYKTPQGQLTIWYQYPDFYRLNVSAGDTLFVFGQNRVRFSVIEYLLDRSRLKVRESISDLPVEQTIYGEIHHYDNPDRERSHWYALMADENGVTFSLDDMDFELYPIEQMEVDGRAVSSVRWK